MLPRLNRCGSDWKHPTHEKATAYLMMTLAIRVRKGLATETPYPLLFLTSRETFGWQSRNNIHLKPRVKVPSSRFAASDGVSRNVNHIQKSLQDFPFVYHVLNL